MHDDSKYLDSKAPLSSSATHLEGGNIVINFSLCNSRNTNFHTISKCLHLIEEYVQY